MSTGLAVILGLLAGLAVGGGAVWAALSRRLRDSRGRVEQLRTELNHRDVELAKATAAQQSQQDLAQARVELAEQFKGIAAQVTDSNRETFLKELNLLTSRQTKEAEKNVKQLLEPVHTDLRDLRQHVDRAENARERLANETQQLRQVLGDSRMRGAWGEQGLQRIVELAGLRERVDFVTQTAIGAESQLRPDMVVHLPDNVDVVIDAKAPLDAYKRAIEAGNAGNNQERDEFLRQHAEALRGRAKELDG